MNRGKRLVELALQANAQSVTVKVSSLLLYNNITHYVKEYFGSICTKLSTMFLLLIQANRPEL